MSKVYLCTSCMLHLICKLRFALSSFSLHHFGIAASSGGVILLSVAFGGGHVHNSDCYKSSHNKN